MGFSLVGISGQDIWEGNKTLTLALTWQLMRAHTLSLLKREEGGDVTEETLINWANEKEKECGKTHPIKNFKDKAAIKTASPSSTSSTASNPALLTILKLWTNRIALTRRALRMQNTQSAVAGKLERLSMPLLRTLLRTTPRWC